MLRPDPVIQPYMEHGVRVSFLQCEINLQDSFVRQVYLKSWTGTTIGFPPAEGGGGPGERKNSDICGHMSNIRPIQLYQTNSGHP